MATVQKIPTWESPKRLYGSLYNEIDEKVLLMDHVELLRRLTADDLPPSDYLPDFVDDQLGNTKRLSTVRDILYW